VTSHSKLAACHKERKWGRMEESKRRGAEGEDRAGEGAGTKKGRKEKATGGKGRERARKVREAFLCELLM